MEGGSLTDAQVLLRLRRDPDAICVLYDRYVFRLVQFLESSGATREAAWDAAQETFAKLLEQRRECRLSIDESLWPWLSVSTRNLLRDWQRRGKVDDRARRRLGVAVVLSTDGELEGALTRLDGESIESEIEAALTALSGDQRTAVTSRVIDEAGYDEIAVASGTSEQAIRGRVSRGLRAMRTLLEGGRQ
jgi:RNA polymerase sigma factor (sigma-70 family)